MKICLISGEFPPMQGGVGDYTYEMAEAYVELGHDVLVVTSQEGTGRANGRLGEHLEIRPVASKWSLKECRQIVGMIREERPDVVNIQYQAAAYGMKPPIHLLPLLIQASRLPTVVSTTYHDLRVPYLFPKAGRARWWAVLALARWSNAVVVTNAEDEATLHPMRYEHLAQIPIGSNIDPDPPEGYDRAAWRERLSAAEDEILLAYFGFLNESKGGETLVRTLARLVGTGLPVKLLMVGGKVGSSDPTNVAYAEHIDQLIEDLGLAEHVISTGYVPEDEVSANLLACDICVLPYKDGISFRRGTFMAALAHGLPIVSTRYPQAKKHIPNPAERWHPKELKGGSNILLVPPEDEAIMADAISRLIASPSLRHHLSVEARALSESFRWPEIARQTLELYHECGAPD
jgi:glycosyltransferase involved in cell wall biosynthesis